MTAIQTKKDPLASAGPFHSELVHTLKCVHRSINVQWSGPRRQCSASAAPMRSLYFPAVEHRLPLLLYSMSRSLPISIALALSTVGFAVAGAQTNSNTRGFMIGAGLSSMTVQADFGTVNTSEFGIGYHGEVAYGMERPVVFFARFSSTVIDSEIDYDMTQVDVGARYLFLGAAQNFRPYVELGLARRAVTQLDVFIEEVEPRSISSSSLGVTGGAGAHLFVTPRLAVDAAVTVSPGTFSEWSTFGQPVPVESVNVTTLGVRAGVKFWPFSK